MWGRTQRAGEPRPGRLVFALRSAVWPLEGAALPPTRGGRRGKEAAGALLGAEPPGLPAGVVMTLSLAGRPRELEAGPPPCASFALCSQGPGRSRPEPQTLGSGRSLGPWRGRAGSRRVFISRPRMPEPAGGPGDLRLVAETEPPGATSPGRFPGGRGWCPFPAPPARPWALPGVARSDPTWLAVALLPRDGRGARGVAPGGIGEVLSPRGVGRAGPPHPGACLRTLEPRPPPRAGPVSKTPTFPPSVRLSDPVTWWGAGAPRARRWP